MTFSEGAGDALLPGYKNQPHDNVTAETELMTPPNATAKSVSRTWTLYYCILERDSFDQS